MKKVLAIAFVIGLVIASCSKKSDNSLQDSNIMLQEPEATTVSPAAVTEESAAAPAPVSVADSTQTK